MGEQEEKHIPSAENSDSEVVAHYPHGISFRDRAGNIMVIPHPAQRSGEDKNDLREKDIRELAYFHPENDSQNENASQETEKIARQKLQEFREGKTDSVAVGIEIEGVLYDKDGNLMAVHGPVEGGGHVTFDDAPPERYDAQLEIVTGPIGEKDNKYIYPSSVLQVKDSLVDAVKTGERIADKRNGLLVFSSVPEGGFPEQLRLTQHPKIISSYERGQTGVHPDTPDEIKDLSKALGLNEIVPFHGTHAHTSNPELSSGKYDAKAAYAAGILALTQGAQLESFMLHNTRQMLGQDVGIKGDVRSLIRRTTTGALGAPAPESASALVDESVDALVEGDTHEMSRYPVKEQHNKVRYIKEFGTTEYVGGAATPDMRHILAHTFYQQLTRVLSYEALANSGGDETKVLSYLQNEYKGGKYKDLFNIISTREGANSSYQQELRFNNSGFDAGVNGKTYRNQIRDLQELVSGIGRDYPAFRTQAKIVAEVFGKMRERPVKGMSVGEYLNPETGMKGGILTDYKGDDIEKNISEQAAGTRKQVAMLERVKSDKDLLKFFGIKSKEDVRSRHRVQEKHHRELASSRA